MACVFGSQLTWRFASLVYFGRHHCRSPGAASALAGAQSGFWPKRRQLIWGFCASFGVFLASLLAPKHADAPLAGS